MAFLRKLKYENTDNAYRKPSYFKIDNEAGKSKAVLIALPLLITVSLAAVLLSLMIGFLLGCYCQAQADHDEYLEDYQYEIFYVPDSEEESEDDSRVEDDTDYPDIDLAVLRKEAITHQQGEAVKLTVGMSPFNDPKSRVKWSSDNEKVATVDDHGRVIAWEKGKAHITASAYNAAVTCLVRVA